ARSGTKIVFCEVKTRRTDAFGIPAEAVTPAKQARIRRLAVQWLADNDERAAELRFDVAAVQPDGRGQWIVDVIEGAFWAGRVSGCGSATPGASSPYASAGGLGGARAGQRPRGLRRRESRGRSRDTGRASRPDTAGRDGRRRRRRVRSTDARSQRGHGIA